MDQTQNDSFGSLSNDQGGNMQTGGGVGGLNNVGMNGQKIVPPMPISTGGPIVLNNGGEKKSKKWVMVLIVVLLFLVVAGVMFAVWKSGLSSAGNNDSLVYEYINLLISGEDSKETIDKRMDVASLLEGKEEGTQNIYYSLVKNGYENKDNISYYNSLKNVLAKIEVAKDARSGWDKVVLSAKNTKEILPRYFVSAFLSYTDASYDYFISHRTFDSFLLEYDYPFIESSNTSVRYYDEVINELFDIKNNLYGKISRTGCLDSDGVDYECLNEFSIEEIKTLQFRSIELDDDVRSITLELLNMIVNDANDLISFLMEQNNE